MMSHIQIIIVFLMNQNIVFFISQQTFSFHSKLKKGEHVHSKLQQFSSRLEKFRSKLEKIHSKIKILRNKLEKFHSKLKMFHSRLEKFQQTGKVSRQAG